LIGIIKIKDLHQVNIRIVLQMNIDSKMTKNCWPTDHPLQLIMLKH